MSTMHTPIPRSTMPYTLVFDPGVTTGAALFEGAELLSVGAIPETRICRTLDMLIFRLPEGSNVVYEDFHGTKLLPGMKRTIEIIGMIELLTLKYQQCAAYRLQALGKRPFKHSAEALLKANKPRQTTYLQHHYDAVALGLLYFHLTHPEWAINAYKVSDLLAIDQFSPKADALETTPMPVVHPIQKSANA